MDKPTISVLGGFRLREGAGGQDLSFTEKEAAFLVYLIVNAKPYAREKLVELFWPDRAQDQSLANLRVLITRLRKKIGDRLRASGRQVAFDLDGTESDLRELESALAGFDGSSGRRSEEDLRRVLKPHGGELAAGVYARDCPGFDEWLQERRQDLASRIAAARRALIDRFLARDNPESALEQSRQLIVADPLDEDAHRLHMALLRETGRRAKALACYEELAKRLGDELGAEPQAATQQLAARLRKAGPKREPKTLRVRARTTLLERVEWFWIEKVLQSAMPAGGPLQLSEVSHPEMVSATWSGVGADRDSESDPAAGSGQGQLLDWFARRGRALLVLGEPGAGKTFRLLQLAQEAVAEARDDPVAPVPVVLPLSGWTPAAGSFVSWVREEVSRRYYIPRSVVDRWVDSGSLMLLFDSLDEVAAQHRAACVEAINGMRRDAGLVPIAVSCRTAAYRELLDSGVRLDLDSAIELQPLSATEVDRHLESLGVEFPERRPADGDDRALRPILGNPLMLSLFLEPIEAAPPPAADTEDPRGQLLTRYAQKLLDRASPSLPYPPARFAAWLRSLALGMLDDQQAVFQIERLQPRWLQARGSRLGYLMLSRCLASVAVAAPFVGLTAVIRADDFSALIVLLGGMVCGPLLAAWDHYRFTGPLQRQLPASRRLLNGLAVTAIAVLTLAAVQVATGNRIGPGLVLVAGTFGWLLGWKPRAAGDRADDIRPVAALAWSWRAALPGLSYGFFSGLAWGALCALWFFDSVSSISILLGPIPFFASFGALIAGLRETLPMGPVRANFGTWISARSALIGAGWAAAATTVPVVVIYGPTYLFGTAPPLSQPAPILSAFGLAIGWYLLAPVALTAGYFAFLWYGGIEVMKHLALRLVLWRSRVLPLRIAPFLSAAADAGLLGWGSGGAIFRHRLLLEHFAASRD